MVFVEVVIATIAEASNCVGEVFGALGNMRVSDVATLMDGFVLATLDAMQRFGVEWCTIPRRV